MRRRHALACCVAAAAALAGCAKDSDEVPAACREGSQPLMRALASAPGPVRLSGGVKLSDCVTDGADGGAMSDVGTAFVTVASDLAEESRSNPDGEALLRLGYLAGAL